MMKLFIRAHDLGVNGETAIIHELDRHGLEGVQLVAYKCLEDIAYAPDAVTKERAEQFREAFRKAGKTVPLIGAYFNPVHPDAAKIEKGIAV
ncbi:MAG: sugar phosphate isomerase/epimerase, partial [Oscillospiraceae bacterium]|nr:sugar phosphate isomerase/epimerase [Oscillospiraceae bacterium]